jgi:hypothetical protein
MTKPSSPNAHRPLRIMLDVVLRAGGLAVGAALVPALSNENDGLALGLTVFLVLSTLAFVAALLDGLLQRDRLRVGVVWALVIPGVALLEMADDLRRTMTGPGSYSSLGEALGAARGDQLSTFVFFSLLVGLPAIAGIGLGVVLSLLTPPSATPVRS